jgi:glutamate N-acetyltransferase / amino-acid N-acetyltransferase
VKLPLGYQYATTYAGIRKVVKDDLTVIVSGQPASAAAVFTQNLVQAAPVKLARKHLEASRGMVRAILINAGNANCATRTGDKVAAATCSALAVRLKVPVSQIIPASTGVIGVELDPKLIIGNLPALLENLGTGTFEDAASAIMTTDLVPKVSSAEMSVKGGKISIAGMTKGSGMIHPMMATTLAFVMTDARISAARLKPILKRANERSFSRLTVDGDTSTNDTLVVLANGASGKALTSKDRKVFEKVLTLVLEDLARQIARDGEGASKLITVEVGGARTEKDAVRIARQIANSPLVKTAVAGSDPNWGRIICAAGNAGVAFDPRKVDIAMQGIQVCKAGLAAEFNEQRLIKELNKKECLIQLTIRGGASGKARFFTCDFTEGYIRINASYRT